MKHIYTVLLATCLAPTALLAGPAEQAKDICDIVDGYTQGSYHYFDCLDHIKTIDSTFTLDQTIDFVCSAVDTFYNMDTTDKERCYVDAKAKLNPEILSCQPQYDIQSDYASVPQSFDEKVVADYRALAQTWDASYTAKVEAANNGLIFDLQKSDEGCLNQAYAVSLDGPNPLKNALKECVFTPINAYSSPAISPENQEILAESFVQAHWNQYRFRILMNASLQFDPIAAFNTSCVVEVSSEDAKGYKFYMAGYTVD